MPSRKNIPTPAPKNSLNFVQKFISLIIRECLYLLERRMNLDRRQLIRLGVGATGISLIAPKIVLGAGVPAEKQNLLKGPMAALVPASAALGWWLAGGMTAARTWLVGSGLALALGLFDGLEGSA